MQDEATYIELNTLSPGIRTLVDSDLVSVIGELRWNLIAGYAMHTDENGTIPLHRFVMDLRRPGALTSELVVDHINSDKLDNRTVNLRICTKAENSRNRRVNRNNKTGYKGVRQRRRRFWSKVEYDKQVFRIGSSATPEEAAWMYDQWAIELHGEFALTNFEYV